MKRFFFSFLVFLSAFGASAQIQGTFRHGGIDREYYLYLPESHAPGDPVVFMLHGYGGKADNYFPEFIRLATSEGYAVCCPQGLPDPGKSKRSWNVGYPSQKGWKVDDIDFICALSERLKASYGFRNAFFSGMSNGGEMCYLMAHRRPAAFKAIASIAGLQMEWIYKSMDLKVPVNFIEIHGTEDRTSEWTGDPLNKGGWGEYLAVPEAVQNIVALNKCTHELIDTLPLTKPDAHRVVLHSYEGGKAEVKLYEVIGGGHSRHVADADTPRVLLDFFSRHMDLDEPSRNRTAEILTPAAAPSPRINGARVYGQRPGKPFLYKVPVSGDRPVSITADGLPKGLKIDAGTGIISGSVKKAGTYRVRLKATNASGSDEREFRIEIGDRLALTPPMGWSSWNCWGNTVSQERVMACAKAILHYGLDQYGWSYVNIDDGWQYDRGGKYGAIQPNPKFPDMKGMADWLHSQGLKMGIYSGPWVGTYAGHIGSGADNPEGKYFWVEEGVVNENHMLDRSRMKRDSLWYFGPVSFVREDALQWAEWGVDYMKYDWDPNDFHSLKEMADALNATDRDIVYSISNSAPIALAPALMKYAQVWRTTGDIRDNWESVRSIAFDRQDVWAGYREPGSWPDADMMVLGEVGWGAAEHKLNPTKLTPDEQYTHMTMWAVLSSPMLLGCDLTKLDAFTLGLLKNSEVIDINQDELGLSPVRIQEDSQSVTYLKQLYDGSLVVALFNLSDGYRTMGFSPMKLGLLEDQQVRDVWRQKDVAVVKRAGTYTTQVAPHGVVLLKLSPGIINPKPLGKYR